MLRECCRRLREKSCCPSLLAIGTVLCGCTGAPEGITPVRFEASRYLGTWYEVMRLDHRFERGLTNVNATYGAMDNGRISVVNKGYDAAAGRWRRIEGSARFLEDSNTASLAVTFFWPLSGGYHVFDLDPDYTHALVSGPTRDYLWILARQPTLSDDILSPLIAKAQSLGFATQELIRVHHDVPPTEGPTPPSGQ
ncbi:lipocalin family protein [Pararhodospirillum photometricum]|uniref:Outer membrane lipoprotein Blc n=1 Tax=Pararhodospirillum photometricum DSM 122 TaxID=1150469 RepID=H6SMS0_PARPM|nr:lipocalin family protein [Pararhodospirillum photometricum]CCG09205.1 Lipocalin-like protein [Pararhodospirillum photometricum DSM 122]